MKKILLVDDHSVVRKGIRLLLQSLGSDYNISEAESGEIALKKMSETDYDVLMTDISMPKMTGLELIKQVRERDSKIKILVFTMHLDEAYVTEAFDNGADGYLCKESGHDNEIGTAIEEVLAGEQYYSSTISQMMVKRLFKEKEEQHYTPKEIEVIKYIAEGLVYKEIANEMDISVRTVETHRKNILEKLDKKTNADIIKFAIKNKLIRI